ncbi:hypothetical protein Lpp219_01824 [Lacticaseibacillus paracasei subsp. paracasei Lpp219]|nr:hypothetical protein Lpp219_01824 [Lacticaseibacillus paracasei subsp. paracasei Lpp219]
MADHKLTGLNGCGDKAEQIFIKKRPLLHWHESFFW